jgi:hypothetical protein
LKAAAATLELENRFGRVLWTGSDGSKCYRPIDEDPESMLPMTLTVIDSSGVVRCRYEVRAGPDMPGGGGWT